MTIFEDLKEMISLLEIKQKAVDDFGKYCNRYDKDDFIHDFEDLSFSEMKTVICSVCLGVNYVDNEGSETNFIQVRMDVYQKKTNDRIGEYFVFYNLHGEYIDDYLID